jgi:hypothetical protein
MSDRYVYLDTSAFMKLITPDPGAAPLPRSRWAMISASWWHMTIG